MSRARALTLVGFAVVGAVVAVLLLRPGGGGTEIQAEFADVRGLSPRGNDIRVQGARVGAISKLELTPRGTILMTAKLREGVPRPRRDAVAAIRPLDIFGDSYVALSLGEETAPLEGPIGLARTSSRPQLDQVLRAFGAPVRGGLQALIVELGTGLERRGVDLDRATVELRPALSATDGLVRELASEEAGLRQLVADAERATGQLARRDRQLGRVVDALPSALGATARRSNELDRGLAGLPRTLDDLETTASELEGTARAARPIAVLAGEAAPGLAEALDRTPGFLSETERATDDLRPTLRRTRALLGPLSSVADDLARALPMLSELGPDLGRLTDAAADAAPDMAQGVLVQLPEALSEPGAAADDRRRRLLRTSNVLSCESFGREIGAGCLDGVAGAGGNVGGAGDPRVRPDRDRGSGRGDRPARLRERHGRRAGRAHPGGLPAAPARAAGAAAQEISDRPSPGPSPVAFPANEEALLDFLLGP